MVSVMDAIELRTPGVNLMAYVMAPAKRSIIVGIDLLPTEIVSARVPVMAFASVAAILSAMVSKGVGRVDNS